MNELKKILKEKPEHIENILYEFGFYEVTINYKEIRCAKDEISNATSIRIKLDDNLTSTDFSKSYSGDLISLIMVYKKVEFSSVLKTIKAELNINDYSFTKKREVFGGFYSKIKVKKDLINTLQTYDESILETYLNKYNLRFYKDGINFSTQKKFKIGLCQITDRITTPWYNFNGELIGIMGRYNGDFEIDGVAKWFPLITFPKSQVLYGYSQNYSSLICCECLYIGESEKFVLQLDSMGINSAVALGGHNIHDQQIKHIIQLQPKMAILCFDEGLDEEIIKLQLDKMKAYLRFTNIKVGYVIDRENIILEKDKKQSPTDLGKDKFLELVNNYIEWR